MPSEATIVEGDTQPLLQLTLTSDPLGRTPLDLTGVTAVAWHIGTYTKAATISNAAGGLTQWQPDGLIPPGTYPVRAVVTYADATVETTKGEAMVLVVVAKP